MDNTWVAQFYEETDPVKRMEMLEAHGEDAAGEEASEEAKRNACRKELWDCQAMENADQEKMNLSEALWN